MARGPLKVNPALGKKGKLLWALRRLGALSSLEIKKTYTRMHHFEKKNPTISSQRGPARMFPRAVLWLSTGLQFIILTEISINSIQRILLA